MAKAMSDWKFLNKYRVMAPQQPLLDRYISTPENGFNGMFRFRLRGEMVMCVASDGLGWQHVSVTIEHYPKPPRWQTMCEVKDLFWEPQDWVVQFHPAKKDYVNMHPGCLHLWRPTEKTMPTPDSLMVGFKAKNQL